MRGKTAYAKKTLNETTNDVINFIKLNADYRDPVPWAVAQVIRKRNCPKK
jgi:hypothetical protein